MNYAIKVDDKVAHHAQLSDEFLYKGYQLCGDLTYFVSNSTYKAEYAIRFPTLSNSILLKEAVLKGMCDSTFGICFGKRNEKMFEVETFIPYAFANNIWEIPQNQLNRINEMSKNGIVKLGLYFITRKEINSELTNFENGIFKLLLEGQFFLRIQNNSTGKQYALLKNKKAVGVVTYE